MKKQTIKLRFDFFTFFAALLLSYAIESGSANRRGETVIIVDNQTTQN